MPTRIRRNFQEGSLGAALTDVGTTITFAAAPGFPTLGADEIVALVLDGKEIVHLTAYTSGATTGTIARGQEGTTAVAHASGRPWAHNPTAEDFEVPTPAPAPGAWTFYDEEIFADTVLAHLQNIPAGLTRLRVEFEYLVSASGGYGQFRFNDDAEAQYNWVRQQGSTSANSTNQTQIVGTYNTQGLGSRNFHAMDITHRAGAIWDFVSRGYYSSPFNNFFLGGYWNKSVDITSIALHSGTAAVLTAPRIQVWGR